MKMFHLKPSALRWFLSAALVIGLAACSRVDRQLEESVIEAARRAPGFAPPWEARLREIVRLHLDDLHHNNRKPEKIRLARAAIAAGCQDPLVRYIMFRHRIQNIDISTPDLAREGAALAEQLEKGNYPPYLRAYAAVRAFETWNKAFSPEEEIAGRSRLNDLFWRATFATVKDPALPEWIVRPVAELLALTWKNNEEHRDQIASLLDDGLTRRFGDCATVHYLRAQQAVQRGWVARGNGTASTVAREGWVAFERELHTAQLELDRAWQLDPHDVDIAETAITTCMGLGAPREDMERWFKRGLAAGPDASALCDAKHYFLAPKWGGSRQAQFAFARECLAGRGYGSRSHLLLWITHYQVQRQTPLPESYFAQPEVWADIKRSFEAFFAVCPEEMHYRVDFAYHAWVAQDWPLCAEQLGLVEPELSDFSWIGGREVYERMVAEVKAHQANPVSTK